MVQVYGSIRRLQVTILMDGKWSFIRFKRFDLELKKGVSGSLRKIKIGSEWRMISTIINTESQFYEGYISEYAYLLFISVLRGFDRINHRYGLNNR